MNKWLEIPAVQRRQILQHYRTSCRVAAWSPIMLYESVIRHRKTLTHVSGIDYSHHAPQYIRIVPMGKTEHAWRNDYESMLRTMIYGEQISFDEIMKRLVELQGKINAGHIDQYFGKFIRPRFR